MHEKRYSIARAHGGTLVHATQWGDIMSNSEDLIMFMILGNRALEEASKVCPKCYRTELGTYEVEGWNIWYVCSTWYNRD